MATYTITADSIPDYDSYGIDDYWSCVDWINWHKALKAKYSKTVADQTWQNAWDKQDSFEHAYNWCKYGSTFNSYVNSQGLDASNIFGDVISGGTKITENVIGGATATSKVLKYAIPVLAIILVIGLIIYFGKKYQLFKI